MTPYSILCKRILDDAETRNLQKNERCIYIPLETGKYKSMNHKDYLEDLFEDDELFNSKPCFHRQLLRFLKERRPKRFLEFDGIMIIK